MSGCGSNRAAGSAPNSCWRTNSANPAATHRSYELIARAVTPQFQGHAQATLDAARARQSGPRQTRGGAGAQAVEDARVRYGAEVAKRAGSVFRSFPRSSLSLRAG